MEILWKSHGNPMFTNNRAQKICSYVPMEILCSYGNPMEILFVPNQLRPEKKFIVQLKIRMIINDSQDVEVSLTWVLVSELIISRACLARSFALPESQYVPNLVGLVCTGTGPKKS